MKFLFWMRNINCAHFTPSFYLKRHPLIIHRISTKTCNYLFKNNPEQAILIIYIASARPHKMKKTRFLTPPSIHHQQIATHHQFFS